MQYVPVVAVILTGMTILSGVLLYVIRSEITKATKPIQPDANGGKSLPDAIQRIDVVVERQTDVIRDLRALRERLDDHVYWHLSDKE